MKIQTFLQELASMNELSWVFPDGTFVPAHAHVTEVALMTRLFVDCGGTQRMERRIQLQLWVANDVDHRLAPSKLARIIQDAEAWLEWENHEVEVEFQGHTIERYGVELQGGALILVPLHTNCLAPDRCGIPVAVGQEMAVLEGNGRQALEGNGGQALERNQRQSPGTGCCAPGSGCC